VTEGEIQEARSKIVAALNLTPLVPPQSDAETDNVVNEAWAGLHDFVIVARRVAELEAALREIERELHNVETDETLYDAVERITGRVLAGDGGGA
jgi:hypothetical protein